MAVPLPAKQSSEDAPQNSYSVVRPVCLQMQIHRCSKGQIVRCCREKECEGQIKGLKSEHSGRAHTVSPQKSQAHSQGRAQEF